MGTSVNMNAPFSAARLRLASTAALDGQFFARSARYARTSSGSDATSTGLTTGISSMVGNVTPFSRDG